MSLSRTTSPQIFCRSLHHAQQKLMQADVPLQISAVSYVRICCQFMGQTHQASSSSPSRNRILWNHQDRYLELLEKLKQVLPDWWNTCYVNQGRLESHDLQIHSLLAPLNNLACVCDIVLVPEEKLDRSERRQTIYKDINYSA